MNNLGIHITRFKFGNKSPRYITLCRIGRNDLQKRPRNFADLLFVATLSKFNMNLDLQIQNDWISQMFYSSQRFANSKWILRHRRACTSMSRIVVFIKHTNARERERERARARARALSLSLPACLPPSLPLSLSHTPTPTPTQSCLTHAARSLYHCSAASCIVVVKLLLSFGSPACFPIALRFLVQRFIEQHVCALRVQLPSLLFSSILYYHESLNRVRGFEKTTVYYSHFYCILHILLLQKWRENVAVPDTAIGSYFMPEGKVAWHTSYYTNTTSYFTALVW